MNNNHFSIPDSSVLKSSSESDDLTLCAEIRNLLIDSVSKTGGHLASNLGIVELTVALHKCFDVYHDRLIFDVGHQSYIHKLLTDRAESFSTLRQENGISGFPKPQESTSDAFIAGHASTAVSVALGMARARTLLHQDYFVVSIVGDGALTGGLTYEALNDAGASGENLIVILNDNGMSISKNVGAISKHLSRIRVKKSYLGFKQKYRECMTHLPGGPMIYRFTHRFKTSMKRLFFGMTMFEDMGFTYLGPVDGHNLRLLTDLIQAAKNITGPVLIHVLTKKGKGYPPAEENPDLYHAVGPFNAMTGIQEKAHANTFSSVFGEEVIRLAEKDNRICCISAAMLPGTGLTRFFDRFPYRCFDVGIAEEHAVTMAAAMANQGMIPIVAIYSTFLQRSFDMLIHDVALQNEHVIFCIDRAGVTGEDGETHQGAFDIGYLKLIPNMTILSPSSTDELKSMMQRALYEIDGPVSIRYPKGSDIRASIPAVNTQPNITIVSYGILYQNVLLAAKLLQNENIYADCICWNTVIPSDFRQAIESAQKTGHLLIVEDTANEGAIGNDFLRELEKNSILVKFKLLNLENGILKQGTIQQIWSRYHLTPDGIANAAKEVLNYE